MQILAEIKEEIHEDAPTAGAPRFGIGINKGPTGREALKWALEKIIPQQALVCLVHVRTPLRSIPNGIGGKYPVENVNPETVNKYKEQLFQETDKIMRECKTLCEKRKIRAETYYVEHTSVQKGLLHQIFKLGMTSLILGKSPQNAFARALRKDIPTSVSKHAPTFCTVTIVCKGKLYSVKDATQSQSLPSSTRSSTDASTSERSETSTSSADGHHDETRRRGHIDEQERSPWSTIKDDERSIKLSQSPLMAFSKELSYKYNKSQNGNSVDDESQTLPAISRTFSGPMQGRSHESESASNRVRLWSSGDYTQTQISFDRSQVSAPTDSEFSEMIDSDGTGEGQNSSTPTEQPRDFRSSQTLLDDIYMTMDDSEIILYPNFEALSQVDTDNGRLTNQSIPEGSSEERSLQGSKQHIMSSKISFTNSNKRAEREEAFREAKAALQQAAIEAMRCEEPIDLLKDQDTLQKRIDEEARKNQETRTELENLKKLIENYAIEANLSKQQAETERRRCEETLVKLEDVTKRLESESLLRKEAEEKAFQKAIEKLDAALALQKEQQKFFEYTFNELQTATNNFSEDNKLGGGGYESVYKGKLDNKWVAIKVLAKQGPEGHEDFRKEVEFLSRILHPHVVTLLGACSEKSCVVYEYMENGSLEDHLNSKDGTPALPWYVRFRICLDIATTLLFLHSRPQSVVHQNLKPSNILLDNHFVSKIGDTGLTKLGPASLAMYESSPVGAMAYIDPDYQRTGVISCEADIYSLGIIMLQLLTGRPAIGVADLVEEAVDCGQLEDVLDKSAGDWPISEAMALACLSMQCAEPRRRRRPKLETKILPDLEKIQNVAGMAAAGMNRAKLLSAKEKPVIPNVFFCPISQEIMKNPHMAADGFTYEYDAINTWLQEHVTSPMTNLALSHKNLIPDHTLRSTIKEWNENGLLA